MRTILFDAFGKVCDRCGKRVVLDSLENRSVAQEFIHINHTCGFDSVIGDGLILDIDLCDGCIKELLLPFARISKQGWLSNLER